MRSGRAVNLKSEITARISLIPLRKFLTVVFSFYRSFRHNRVGVEIMEKARMRNLTPRVSGLESRRLTDIRITVSS